jgi:hypothetical protein
LGAAGAIAPPDLPRPSVEIEDPGDVIADLYAALSTSIEEDGQPRSSREDGRVSAF